MNEQMFVNWDGLVYYDGKIKTYVENNIAECLKFGGIITYAELPHPEYDTVNYTYTITDSFTADSRFLEPGIVIPPKTTVQVVEVDGEYKYSVFKEEEVNLQPVYQDIENLRAQVDNGSKLIDSIQTVVEEQSSSINDITTAHEATAAELEQLTTTIETLEGTISSIEDLSDRTDERVDGLTENMLDVTTNVTQLTKVVDTKADQNALVGLASETYVQTKIAEAQLNSDGDIDLSVYVTQEELNTRFEQVEESIKYGDF